VSDDTLIEVALEETRDKMHRAIEHAKSEFATIRTGRAAPALVERLKIEYFGSEVPLLQLAGVTVAEARTLIINPYDKTAVKAIEKAILSSDLGVNPANDGQVLRLNFPPLTEERRKELVKVARQRAEDGRVALRNVRRQTRHELESFEHDGEISSDDLERAEKVLETLTHETVGEIDRLLAHKEQELLEV
jgi:ribosome recycling factor